MDDIGSGIADAALNGFRLGKQREQDEILRGWQDYAASLERKLEKVQDTLADTQRTADMEANLRNRAQELLRDTCSQKDKLQKKVAEQEQQLKEVKGSHEEYRDFIESKLRSVEGALRATSAKTAAFEGIYNLLLDEIKQLDNPDRFRSLDVQVMKEEVERRWKEFEATGKLVYKPKLPVIANY